MIKFGTDGWRGEIARDFTFENIYKVALAAAMYIEKQDDTEKSLVIGYDTRFLGKEFSEDVAKVLAWKGIKVYMVDGVSSTPQVSYHTKMKNATLGIMITASHNPGIYNGFKIKASFGGPAIPEQVQEVEAELAKIWDNTPANESKSFAEYQKAGLIELFDAKTPYIDYIKEKIDMDAINAKNYKIIYDPMYGSGIETINMLLPNAEEIHGEYNPSFGEVDHPEPIENCLPQLIAKIKNGNYDVGLATDGDADRLGAVDGEGNFVDPHRVFMILMKYLYEVEGKRGMVVKTVSLTSMVDKYCKAKGIELVETPVGFKHAAKYMNETEVLIGGEESGGLGTIIHIPERDGIFNGMLLLEAMAKTGKSLKELSDELDTELGVHRFKRIDKRVTQEIKDQVLNAAKNAPKKLGNYEISEINTKDGFKFMIDGGWLLIRASGTEPLLRFYAEGDSIEKVEALLKAGMELK